MLYRNINLNYKLSDDKTLLTINYIEENKTGYKNIIKEYDLINIDDTITLYNTISDDFGAEYDDDLARLIDKLVNKIMKDNEEVWNMIKLEKIATYYSKNNFLRQSKISSTQCTDLQEALEIFKNTKPRYYINKKDISIIETIQILYKIDLGYKKIYKTIDPITESIETNYKEEE